LMMNPFSWLQMTDMISYQGLVRTFPRDGYPDVGLKRENVCAGTSALRNSKKAPEGAFFTI
ncbi:hypothetical protein, partial [Aeromonas veronii]|uniref:hypothetical protein n=1 Tax=Aeromonas veronii TaxID=654 RepID=UPI003D1C5F52